MKIEVNRNITTKAESFIMNEVIEPVMKKAKVADVHTIDSFIDNMVKSKNKLQAVLSDEFYSPLPLIEVYVGAIKDKKELSKVITLLNEKIPLKELNHLKRANKKDVLLCPIHFLNTLPQESIQMFLEENISELKDSFEYFKIIHVPLHPPKLKKQNLEIVRTWSCNFHPNKYLESLFNGDIFSEEVVSDHRVHMGLVFQVARWHLSKMNPNLQLSDILLRDANATVVFDPVGKSVVAVAFDNRETHPVQHSTMLAIDNVAKTQNGGVWNTNGATDVTICGIDKELLLHLKSIYPSIKFGARTYFDKSYFRENDLNAKHCPYLCTGYYVYLLREPCLMCAMALVHARAKRVFFCLKNTLQGALCSRTKLQCVTSLNHHFEVFTDFL